MDTEITKLIQALRGISNKLEEIYGKPGETTQITEEPKPQMQALPNQPEMQQLPMSGAIQTVSAPQAFNPQSFDQLVPQSSFEVAPVNTQNSQQIVETDAEKIKRLESELQRIRHQNINFNFAPTAIGGTYGQGNY